MTKRNLLPAIMLVLAFSSGVQAQAFVKDNDGLLDVGEAPGYPAIPAGEFGSIEIIDQGIQELDAAKLLTNVDDILFWDDAITGVEPGVVAGAQNLPTRVLVKTELTELNLTGASFEGLETCSVGLGIWGFCTDSKEMTSLVLDKAALSQRADRSVAFQHLCGGTECFRRPACQFGHRRPRAYVGSPAMRWPPCASTGAGGASLRGGTREVSSAQLKGEKS